MRAECEEHNILNIMIIYSDDGGVAKEKDNIVPLSHPHVFLGQFSLENVNDLVFVLNGFDAVGYQDQKWSQREALNQTNNTELSMTR